MGASNIGSSKYPLAKIPAMADPADIQVALKYYHWGSDVEPEAGQLATAGISYYLDEIDSRIDTIDTNINNIVNKTIIDAKGDLFVGSGDNAVDNLTVGSDGYVLTADTNATLGVKWSAPVVASTQITGLGTGVATFLETPSSANLASAITNETGSGSLVFATSPSLTTPTITRSVMISPQERMSIVTASAPASTTNIDVLTSSVFYYTTAATANFTINVRGDGTPTTLDSLMTTGDAITVVFLNTSGATAYYPNVFKIDSTTVTPKWQGGTAPSSGNANSIDSYSYTIIKTGSAAFTVLASQTKFA